MAGLARLSMAGSVQQHGPTHDDGNSVAQHHADARRTVTTSLSRTRVCMHVRVCLRVSAAARACVRCLRMPLVSRLANMLVGPPDEKPMRRTARHGTIPCDARYCPALAPLAGIARQLVVSVTLCHAAFCLSLSHDWLNIRVPASPS
jgi:hypothetical protein